MNGKFKRALAPERERRHARRPGRRAVQQLPQQVAGLAVPAHRSGLSLSDVRRRLGRRGSRADARQDVREAGARRELDALWGNFKINYADNELAQVDRGLYGGNLHYQTEAHHELRRAALLASTASPPSPARWRAARNSAAPAARCTSCATRTSWSAPSACASSCATRIRGWSRGVVNLRPVLDYDIDYLQGRVVLAEPLNSTVDDQLLVRSGALSGDEAYLVVRYEYTPGFDRDRRARDRRPGARLGERLRQGRPHHERQRRGRHRQQPRRRRRHAAHELRIRGSRCRAAAAKAWFRARCTRTTAASASSIRIRPASTAASADAYRADLSVGFGDVIDEMPGRLTLYSQSLGAGYSAPGLGTLTDVEHSGGTFNMRMFERLDVRAKADKREQDQGLFADTQELNLGYQITDRWSVSTGARKDEREYTGPLVPLNREQGERTDGVLQVGYDSGASWRAYGFVQNTLSKSEERPDNDRFGTGGSYRMTERFRVDAEVSDGDLGPGGRLGTNYLFSERTTLYLNYALENERTDNGLRGGRRGNLISGMKRRLSDSSSMFVEERYQETDYDVGPHARDRHDARAERALELRREHRHRHAHRRADRREDRSRSRRRPHGLRLPGGAAVERRRVSARQDRAARCRLRPSARRGCSGTASSSSSTRTGASSASSTTPRARARSASSTTAATPKRVLGYGYRPVANDRLNALAKYTYFYNVPTTEQVTPTNSIAQFVQKSHVAALDLTYDLTDRVVDRRQVRLSPRPVEPGPREAAVLRQQRAALHRAHRPEVRRAGKAWSKAACSTWRT